jgi:hypothetical protein
MTDEGQLNFDGLPGDAPALEKKPILSCQPLKPGEISKASSEPEPPADEALEPADIAPVPGPDSAVEESTAIVPATRPYATDESIPEEEPASGSAPEYAGAKVEASGPVFGAEAKAIRSSEARRLFLLTNRMNLNGILSSRILAPRESFHKYYSDLLELSPGWVPLLAVQPTAQLVKQVVAERGAGVPVLVELSESVLNGRDPDSPVTYVRAALLSDVVAIHFREERSLREHRARGYSNVHPYEDLLRVSAELFTSASEAEFPIGAPEDGAAVDWLQIDRARGAVNGLLAAGDSGEGLAVAAGALGALRLPEGTILPRWLTWDALTGTVLPAAPESEAELADRLIFQTAYRILGERDLTESWSPSEVLETVASEITATQPGPAAQILVDRNLRRVRELVNVERDFEPLRNPGSPYVAAKSFLMVLLRPDLGQLLDWPPEETGADHTTRAVAAVLAGRLRGLARESVKLRNRALDDLTAACAVQAAHGVTCSRGAAEFLAGRDRTALLLNGAELRAAAPLIPTR